MDVPHEGPRGKRRPSFAEGPPGRRPAPEGTSPPGRRRTPKGASRTRLARVTLAGSQWSVPANRQEEVPMPKAAERKDSAGAPADAAGDATGVHEGSSVKQGLRGHSR